jgi:hypothetical protein
VQPLDALQVRRTSFRPQRFKEVPMRKYLTPSRKAMATLVAPLAATLFSTLSTAARADDDSKFPMVRSPALATVSTCAPNARGYVRIEPRGAVEEMDVVVEGLPANTDFDFFVIQQPNGPFGMAWYQGDIETNAHGRGHGRFVGRFNEETFIVAPGAVPAPSVHNNAFPDATLNPATGPIHTYHLGLWFNSPQDAAKAGCPGGVTPFNGEHNAGIQVLNTSNFPNLQGPLLKVKP